MARSGLDSIPDGACIFTDANIFIYWLLSQSGQCSNLITRCTSEGVLGATSFAVVNEVTHRLMILEARNMGLIAAANVRTLERNPRIISALDGYWATVEILLAQNLLLIESDIATLRQAQAERKASGLLTNDSIIVATMRRWGISRLASADWAFERVEGIELFRPDDLRMSS